MPSVYRFSDIPPRIDPMQAEYDQFRAANPFGSWPDYLKQKADAAWDASAALEALNAMETEKFEEGAARNAAIKAANREKSKKEQEEAEAKKASKQLARMAVEKPKTNTAKRQERKSKISDEENRLGDDLSSDFDKLEVDKVVEVAGVDELRSGFHKLKVDKAKRGRGRK